MLFYSDHNCLHCLPAPNGATDALGNFPDCLTGPPPTCPTTCAVDRSHLAALIHRSLAVRAAPAHSVNAPLCDGARSLFRPRGFTAGARLLGSRPEKRLTSSRGR